MNVHLLNLLLICTFTLTALSQNVCMFWNEKLELLEEKKCDSLELFNISNYRKYVDNTSDCHSKGTVNKRVLVFYGERDIIQPGHLFEYNPIEYGGKGFYQPYNSRLNSTDTSCNPVYDPLPDGLWLMIEEKNRCGDLYIKAMKEIKNKHLCGEYFAWGFDQNLKVKVKYYAGFPSDTLFMFYSNGNVASFSIYQPNCNLISQSVDYYRNGRVSAFYSEFLGIKLFFDKINGLVRKVARVRNNFFDGEVRYYDENGELYLTEIYNKGVYAGVGVSDSSKTTKNPNGSE